MFRSILVSMLVSALTLTAQAPQTQDYTVTVHVELVTLPVSVIDKKDQPVVGLQAEHFRVFEDKIEQNVSLFKQEDVPVSVGLVVDSSGSMYNTQDRLITATMRFAQESNPEDETFIVSFADYPTLSQDFTGNASELERSLREISPHGSTALYDAVAYAADHLSRATHDKKVLLVITDGEDNNSRLGLKDVLEDLKESNIIVYTIGLLNYEGILGSDISGKAKKALKELAEVTGGQAYFPKSVKDVDGLCRRVARDLRNQYTIAYRPTNEALDGSWRTIHVQVLPPKGMPALKVRTKRGYYAPTASHSATDVTSRVRP